MKPVPFEYHRPASSETFDLLDRYGDDGRLLAGGQSRYPPSTCAWPRRARGHRHQPHPGSRRHSRDRRGARHRRARAARGASSARRWCSSTPAHRGALPHPSATPRSGARRHLRGQLRAGRPRGRAAACRVWWRWGATIRVGCRGGTRDIAADDFFRGIYTTALAREIVTEILCRAPPQGGAASSTSWRDATATSPWPAWPQGLESNQGRGGDQAGVLRVGTGRCGRRRARGCAGGRRATRRRVAAAGRALDGDLDPPGPCTATRPARHLARRAAGTGRGGRGGPLLSDRADRQRHRHHARVEGRLNLVDFLRMTSGSPARTSV